MQSTISTSPDFFFFFFFLFIHKHNPNHLLPVLEVIAFSFFLSFFFLFLNQLCHKLKSVVPPLYGTLCYTEIKKCKFSLS